MNVDYREYFCDCCGTLVARIAISSQAPSKIKAGTVMYCKACESSGGPEEEMLVSNRSIKHLEKMFGMI